MKAVVLPCYFGVVAFGEDNNLVGKAFFQKKPLLAAKKLIELENGRITEEIVKLIIFLKSNGYEIFVFENTRLARDIRKKLDVQTDFSKRSEAGELFRSRVEEFAVQTGFARDLEDFNLWAHKINMEIAKLRIKGAIEKRDVILAQAIHTLDDLEKTANLFVGRLREWYGIHFPELDRLVEKHETYARLVRVLKSKDNFSFVNLQEERIPEVKAKKIAIAADKSMGAALSETNLLQIQELSKTVLELYRLRGSMESYLDKEMDEVAPNIKAIVGSSLGARLIAAAGSLESLARKPASTIQVLGAEKALFRSLKTGARPPKHGMIFQHSMVHEAKGWQRGKIARALAGKLAIAARADAFSQENISDRLKAALEKRLEEIRQKYKDPPPIQKKKPRREKKRRSKKWRKQNLARKA